MIDLVDVWKQKLDEDLGLCVVKGGSGCDAHFHFWIWLVLPECQTCLFEDLYRESWKVRMFKLEKESRSFEAEENAFFVYVDRLRGSEGLGCGGAL